MIVSFIVLKPRLNFMFNKRCIYTNFSVTVADSIFFTESEPDFLVAGTRIPYFPLLQ